MSETCRLLLDNLWLAFSGIHAICFSGTLHVETGGVNYFVPESV